MVAQLNTPVVLLLLLFASLVAVYSFIGVTTDPGRMRILAKPAILLLATITLTFVWSHRDIIEKRLLLKLAFAGVLTGLAITILKILAMHLIFISGFQVQPRSIIIGILHLYDSINDELKILVMFAPISVLAVKSTGRRYLILLAMLATILVTSFYSIGYHNDIGNIGRAHSETAQFGVVLSILVLLLAGTTPKLMTNLLFSGMAFVLVNAPWIFQLWYAFVKIVSLPKEVNIRDRAEIWDAVARKVLEAPFFGFGIDSVRYLKNIDMKNEHSPYDALHHPHNMVLQLWLDIGAVGVAIFVGLVYLGWRFVSQLSLPERPPVLAGLTMMAIFALVTHSMWQTWVTALFCSFVALISIAPAKNNEHKIQTIRDAR